MMQKIVLSLALAFSASLIASVQVSRDPIGELANYELDKSSARTTSLIQSGSAVSTVKEFLPDHPNGPSYNVSLDYDFKVKFYGQRKGTASWPFSQDFFDEQFIINLRTTGIYETPDYKIRHQGYADARTLDGSAYPNSDVVLIYDIKVPEKALILDLLYASVGIDPSASNKPPLEDLTIKAHLFAGVPVLSAVKLDLAGKVQGINAKAGLDYRR